MSVLKSSKDLRTLTLARCSQLIVHHEQGGTGYNLRCKQVQLDCTKFFFTNDVVREWNKLPPSVVQCDTINLLNPFTAHVVWSDDPTRHAQEAQKWGLF